MLLIDGLLTPTTCKLMKYSLPKFLTALVGIVATGVSYADYPGCPIVEPECPCDYVLPDPNNYGVMFGVKGCETKKLIFSGLIQTDYQFIHVEDKANKSDLDPSDVNNFLMRRVRFGFEAELGEGWKGVIITEFSGKEKQIQYKANADDMFFSDVNDIPNETITTNWCHGIFGLYAAYIEKYCSGNFFRAGYKKVNFGREELVEASDLKAIERSIVTNYFNGCQLANVESGSPLGLGERHVGIFMDGVYDHFGYGAAVTNGYKCAKSCSSSLKSSAASGSVTYSPDNELGVYGNLYYMNDFNCIDMEIGVNFAYQPKGDNFRLQYNVNTAWSPKRGQMFGYNPYAFLKYKGWTLLAEVMGAHIENGGVDGITDVSPFGVTVMPSYMWNDQLELVARAAYLDTDHRGTRIGTIMHCAPETRTNVSSDGQDGFSAGDIYGKATAWYLGFNYYMMNRAIKFSAGYEYASFEDRHSGNLMTISGEEFLDPNGFGQPSSTFPAFVNDKSKVHTVRARVQLVF